MRQGSPVAIDTPFGLKRDTAGVIADRPPVTAPFWAACVSILVGPSGPRNSSSVWRVSPPMAPTRAAATGRARRSAQIGGALGLLLHLGEQFAGPDAKA
jgi:hypothetical protein